jgi:hypothetical protein
MKTSATGKPGVLMTVLRGAPRLLGACCLLLLSRPRLAQPWTAGGGAKKNDGAGR